MIIKSLTLTNFRVFSGTHTIALEPTTDNKNIVLFGGLNGAGKTSILSAIKLALYGPKSIGFNITKKEYSEKLDQLIHLGNEQHAPEEASIELTFTYSQNGSESEITVVREWTKGQKDELCLLVDNIKLRELNYDQCQGYLDGLIPSGVSDLFFFDGEKIAELAEDESGQILRTAVKRLLGLNIVEKLQNDLDIYLKRQGLTKASKDIQNEISDLEQQRKDLDGQAEMLENEFADLNAAINIDESDIQVIEQELSQQGGAWAKSREQEVSKVDELIKQKAVVERELRTEIDNFFPISLAKNSCQALLKQLDSEASSKNDQAFSAKLNELSQKNDQLDLATIELLKQSVSTDSAPVVLDLSSKDHHQLQYQIEVLARQSEEKVKTLTKELSNIETDLDSASENIQRAPQQSQLEQYLTHIRQKEKQKTDKIVKRADMLQTLKQLYRQAQDIARKEQKLHSEIASQLGQAEGVDNAQNAQLVLNEFAQELTQLRVQQLEAEFIASYKLLARKEDLDISARINPVSFDVELISDDNKVINRKQLSAGEKQIYAIAILEALGKVSGHKLPVIIDTPLGRLDSAHRDKLIEHYLPNASHQVIILSTDTEVDEQYYNWLEDHVSHAFEIQFNAQQKSSKLVEGYFWQQLELEAI